MVSRLELYQDHKNSARLVHCYIAISEQSSLASTVERSNTDGRTTEAYVPYLKPVLAGLLASAIVYLCFLTWLHWKAVSLVKEQGATGFIAVTGAQVYVLHSPSFWALAIVAFGVLFPYFVTRRCGRVRDLFKTAVHICLSRTHLANAAERSSC